MSGVSFQAFLINHYKKLKKKSYFNRIVNYCLDRSLINVELPVISPDVLLILREAPVGNAELELFWNRGVDLLHHLKWDVERYLFC